MQGLSPKQVFKTLSFVTFVSPSSLLAVRTQRVYTHEAYFVYKDYSSTVMVSQLVPVVQRRSTLTVAKSVSFALG